MTGSVTAPPQKEPPRDALPNGARLGEYVIERFIDRGGFGITYYATNALRRSEPYAIKEFFPIGLAVRNAGEVEVHPARPDRADTFWHALDRFADEARTIARFDHPNVVDVRGHFALNGTAYMVMRYEAGISLAGVIGASGPLSAGAIKDLLPPLLGAISAVHAGRYIHRDIKPSNIMIRTSDRCPVLLDFGAAREVLGEEGVTTFTEIRTPGYAPHEQYFRDGDQGPWTDVYALGATLYCCIKGHAPPEAPARVERDAMVPARVAGKGRYPAALLSAIDAMLAVRAEDRPRSIAKVIAMIAPRSEDSPTGPDILAEGNFDDGRGPWQRELEQRIAAAFGSAASGDDLGGALDRAKRKTRVLRVEQWRARIALAICAMGLALTLGAVAHAYFARVFPAYLYPFSAAVSALGTVAALFILCVVPAVLLWRLRRHGAEPLFATLCLAAGATLIAGLPQLRDYYGFIVRAVQSPADAVEAPYYVFAAGLVCFGIAAVPLWWNGVDGAIRRLRIEPPRVRRRLIAYAAGIVGAVSAAAIAAIYLLDPAPAMTAEQRDVRRIEQRVAEVKRLVEQAEKLADAGEKEEDEAVDLLRQAERIDPSSPLIEAARVRLAERLARYVDAVILTQQPLQGFRRVQAAKLLARARRFKPDLPLLAQVEAKFEAIKAGHWSGGPDCEGCPELAMIPAGTLMLGSPAGEKNRSASEGPQFRVTIAKAYLIGKFEVTRAEYAKYAAEAGPAAPSENCGAPIFVNNEFRHEKERGWRNPGFADSDRHPVVCVSWFDAEGFVRWLSRKTGKRYRLPSEAQWEYAARAGSATPFAAKPTYLSAQLPSLYGQPRIIQVPKVGNVRSPPAIGIPDGHALSAPTAVGSQFAENGFRLHDVHGNAGEWVQDCWIADYGLAPGDGRARGEGEACNQRVWRGGSWARMENEARSAARAWAPADTRRNDLGFRVARELD